MSLVSICIPTFNSAQWIRDSLGSALAQTYAETEILVVDNASSDGTAEVVRSYSDPRIRLEVNEENIGAVRNFNRCIDLARGEYVKLLMSDDLLYPNCVAKMIQLFLESETLGLVFSPRDILMDEPERAPHEWLRQISTLHASFKDLKAINRGRDLFQQYLAGGLRGNWIGEPTCVMVRRRCFEKVGGFNPRLCQEVDYAMWLRILFFYDVGFVDEKLSAYRVHPDAATASNKRLGRDWLDLLWLLEDLLRYDEVRAAYPRVRALRNAELYRLLRADVGRIVKAPFGVKRPSLSWNEKRRALGDYLAYRRGLQSITGDAATPNHERLNGAPSDVRRDA